MFLNIFKKLLFIFCAEILFKTYSYTRNIWRLQILNLSDFHFEARIRIPTYKAQVALD